MSRYATKMIPARLIMHMIPLPQDRYISRQTNPAELKATYPTGHMIAPGSLLNTGTTSVIRTGLCLLAEIPGRFILCTLQPLHTDPFGFVAFGRIGKAGAVGLAGLFGVPDQIATEAGAFVAVSAAHVWGILVFDETATAAAFVGAETVAWRTM